MGRERVVVSFDGGVDELSVALAVVPEAAPAVKAVRSNQVVARATFVRCFNKALRQPPSLQLACDRSYQYGKENSKKSQIRTI